MAAAIHAARGRLYDGGRAAHHAAGLAGPDHRGYGAAAHHWRTAWLRPLRLGRHRLSADRDDHRADLWQALGPLGTQADLSLWPRRLPHRLRALRRRANDECADRLPRDRKSTRLNSSHVEIS